MSKFFQSYLIIALHSQSARQETIKLAKSFDIDLNKTSPDTFFIKAQKIEISIDQIRELKSHIYQKPVEYQYKFVVIENAHNATVEAQNSLLKLLEEPPSHAIIVLEAKNKSQLLPTITSRVVTISGSDPEIGSDPEALLEQNLESALLQISAVDNPQEFLDQQIISLSEQLVKSAIGQGATLGSKFTPSKVEGQGRSLSDLSKAIENCKVAKEMIAANVNPNFVLANLIFSTI